MLALVVKAVALTAVCIGMPDGWLARLVDAEPGTVRSPMHTTAGSPSVNTTAGSPSVNTTAEHLGVNSRTS